MRPACIGGILFLSLVSPSHLLTAATHCCSMPPAKKLPKPSDVDAAPSVLGLGVERIKQYGGEEQVSLKVLVDIPGSWFGGGAAGSLTPGERKEKYMAQAIEYAPIHQFKKAGKKATNEQGIRFVCVSDAADDGNTRASGFSSRNGTDTAMTRTRTGGTTSCPSSSHRPVSRRMRRRLRWRRRSRSRLGSVRASRS